MSPAQLFALILMVAESSHGLFSSYVNLSLSLTNPYIRVPLQEVPLFGEDHGIVARDGSSLELTWGPLFGFMANITLGDPPQVFQVLMATGSCDLYVGSVELCYTGEYCGYHKVYNPSISRSFKQTQYGEVSLQYDAGIAQGPVAIDTLNVHGITVPNATFIRANYLGGDLRYNGQMDGILGLSFQEACVARSHSDPNTNLIQTPVFSFYIKKDTVEGSQMILGGVDRSLFQGELTYIKLNQPFRFIVSVNSLRTDEGELMTQPISAAIDTGTTSILLPNQLYYQLFPNGKPCEQLDHLPTIIFNLGGHDFSLEPEYYTTWKGGVCHNRIYHTERANLIVLGTVFLRKYYSVFDMIDKKIGLAPYA